MMSMKDTICPSNCICLAATIRCLNLSEVIVHKSDFAYHFIYVQQCSVDFTNKIVEQIDTFFILQLNHNNLHIVCTKIPSLHISLKLDLAFNLIQVLYSECFTNSDTLKEIKLNENLIAMINSRAFFNLSSLKFLDLSNNNLKDVASSAVQASLNISPNKSC